jgi:hypothetical protein
MVQRGAAFDSRLQGTRRPADPSAARQFDMKGLFC